MIKHLVVFKLKDGLGEENTKSFVERLEGLGREIAEIRSSRVVQGAGINPSSGELLLEANFDSESDFKAYMAHPTHGALVADCVLPWTEARLAFQSMA